MAYDDTASRRSHGGRSSRYDDNYSNDRYYDDQRDRDDRRARPAYYDSSAPPVDNTQLAYRSQLPAAYYEKSEPSVRSARSTRARSRSVTPPRRTATTTRRGDLISAAAGAIALTAADKFLIEPRMKHGRSKSHHETLRRVADVGIGGAAGTAIYRAVSRSRAKKKGALADDESRPGSPDSRRRSRSRGRSNDRDDDRSRSRSKSKTPWKNLIGPAGGAIVGLVAEQLKKQADRNKEGSSRSKSRRRDRSSSDDSDYSRKPSRRNRSADEYDDRRSRGGRHRDHSDDDDSDYDRRHRSSRRSKSKRGGDGPVPHQDRDMVQEAIGLLGVAQGLGGHHKKQAALETAIGAAGLAQNYYERQKRQKQAAMH